MLEVVVSFNTILQEAEFLSLVENFVKQNSKVIPQYEKVMCFEHKNYTIGDVAIEQVSGPIGED